MALAFNNIGSILTADIPLRWPNTNTNVIDDDVFAVLTLEGSVASRDHIGGTAPRQVLAAVERAHGRIEAVFGQG